MENEEKVCVVKGIKEFIETEVESLQNRSMQFDGLYVEMAQPIKTTGLRFVPEFDDEFEKIETPNGKPFALFVPIDDLGVTEELMHKLNECDSSDRWVFPILLDTGSSFWRYKIHIPFDVFKDYLEVYNEGNYRNTLFCYNNPYSNKSALQISLEELEILLKCNVYKHSAADKLFFLTIESFCRDEMDEEANKKYLNELTKAVADDLSNLLSRPISVTTYVEGTFSDELSNASIIISFNYEIIYDAIKYTN